MRTNTGKLNALCPRGGVEGIPAYILDAQGGEIHGFKCVGAFVGTPTAEGTAYRSRELSKALKSRLDPLDSLDAMHDSPSMTGVRMTKYGFLCHCANRLCNHWQRLMPPSIVNPVLDAVVEPRLRATLELIAQSHASDSATQERWWRESALPTDMGGVDRPWTMLLPTVGSLVSLVLYRNVQTFRVCACVVVLSLFILSGVRRLRRAHS